jgi:hypothetical protein
MAQAFSVELTMTESPSEALARAVDVLVDPARVVGLRLTKRDKQELHYKPRVQFPFLIMLWHNLNGERMTVSFEPADGGGTRVGIKGAVASASHTVASDPEHWSEALGAAQR